LTRIGGYLNPSTRIINLEFVTLKSETFTLELHDMTGRVDSSRVIELIKGQNIVTYNTASLVPGYYQLIVQNQYGYKYYSLFLKK